MASKGRIEGVVYDEWGPPQGNPEFLEAKHKLLRPAIYFPKDHPARRDATIQRLVDQIRELQRQVRTLQSQIIALRRPIEETKPKTDE